MDEQQQVGLIKGVIFTILGSGTVCVFFFGLNNINFLDFLKGIFDPPNIKDHIPPELPYNEYYNYSVPDEPIRPNKSIPMGDGMPEFLNLFF